MSATTTQAMETEFTVVDEELESAALPEHGGKGAEKARARRKGFAVSEESAPQGYEDSGKAADASAEGMAKLMEEMAAKAAKKGLELSLETGKLLAAEVDAKNEKRVAEFVAYIKKQSELYAKPQNLCMHVKFGEGKPVKLKHRAAKILPELLVQCDIGRAGGNWPLMFGPTGCGKTVAAEQVAETLKLPFEHVNCSEGMSETWLWGRQTPNGFVPGGLWKCFKDGGVFLFDEADAANDNVWLSINTMLANGHAYNPISGESCKRHADFIAIAAANTNGKGGQGAYTGRSRLDGATLNRFSMYQVDYDTDLERELCPDKTLLERLWTIRVELQKKNSHDVISTRDIKNGYHQAQRGFPVEKILGCLKLRMDKANHSLFEGKGK